MHFGHHGIHQYLFVHFWDMDAYARMHNFHGQDRQDHDFVMLMMSQPFCPDIFKVQQARCTDP